MVVLDASGSMNETDAPGPRIDAAKKAVTSLVTALPADTKVGLTVYGATTGSGASDKAKGCQDIRTLVPVGPLDPASMSAAVNSVKASGYTPIGNALRAAAKALPQEGPRSIVLVSDGEDTCAPPAPCDVAKELKKQGVDLTVHTVGFKVDAKARAQLSCVATATGGTYSDATDADQLTSALKVKVDYAVTGYAARGTKITGADQASTQAPLLQPGQYLDTLAKGADSSGPGLGTGTTKFYTVDLQPDATLYVAGTLVPPARPGGVDYFDSRFLGVSLILRGPSGETCERASKTEIFNGEKSGVPSAVLVRSLGPKNASKRCPVDGRAVLEVSRVGDAFLQDALPLELVVRLEPPADTSNVPSAQTEALPPVAQPRFGPPRSIEGGTGFNDAPRLTSGVTYTDEITTGEHRFFKVDLLWGQRFAYVIKEVGPATPTLDRPAIIETNLYNPLRQPAARTGDTNGRFWFTKDIDKRAFSATTKHPVRWTNRTSSSLDLKHFQLDGAYYIELGARFKQKTPSRTRYLITAVVVGTPEAGPVYQPATDATGPTTRPDSTDATVAPTTAATPPPPGDAATVAAEQSSADSGGPGVLVFVLIAALAALVGAGATVLVTRARRTPPDGTQA